MIACTFFGLWDVFELLQVLCIRKPEEAIDLFMVEIMHMRHKFDADTRLVCLIFCENFF